MTVGPDDLEAMSVFDWAALVDCARRTPVDPGELRGLSIAPERSDPEDLADELDDLLDTNPPREIEMIIVAVLRNLQQEGVALARRPAGQERPGTPRKARRKRRKT